MSNQISYKRGIRRDIMKVLYMCGTIPKRAVPLIRENPRIVQRKIKSMEAEGILSEDRKLGAIIINSYNERRSEYEDYMPEGYVDYYDNVALLAKNKLLYDSKPRRDKFLKDAETLIMFKGAGVKAFIDETERLLHPNAKLSKYKSYYYGSKEVKQYSASGNSNDEVKKYAYTRINGCVFSEGGTYPVYNVGSKSIEWKKFAEEKMKYHLERISEEKVEGQEYIKKGEGINSCILLYRKSGVLNQIIHAKKQKDTDKSQMLNIDYVYECMYGISLTREGQKIVEIITTDGWKQRVLDDFIDRENQTINRSLTVACDGIVDNKYILLHCIPDLSKLKLFKLRAEMENDKHKFSIYCFDHQLDFIIKELGDYAEIYTVDVNEYYQKYMQEYELYQEKRGIQYE